MSDHLPPPESPSTIFFCSSGLNSGEPRSAQSATDGPAKCSAGKRVEDLSETELRILKTAYAQSAGFLKNPPLVSETTRTQFAEAYERRLRKRAKGKRVETYDNEQRLD